MRYFIFILLFLSSLPVNAGVGQIDNQQLKGLLSQGIPIIDIRRPEEWKQTGVVEGSHLLTFFDKQGKYDVGKWLNALEKIAGKHDEFVLICRTGNRTGMVSKFLDRKLGYTKVNHVSRGITAWIRAGNQVTKSLSK